MSIEELDKKYAEMISDRCFSGHQESDHIERDRILHMALTELGMTGTVNASSDAENHKMGFWYA